MSFCAIPPNPIRTRRFWRRTGIELLLGILVVATQANAQLSLPQSGAIQSELNTPAIVPNAADPASPRGSAKGPLINTDGFNAPAFGHRFEGGVRMPSCAAESRDGAACGSADGSKSADGKPAAAPGAPQQVPSK